MNKAIKVLLLLTINFCVQGQNIDQLGLDNNPILNIDEATYLNNYFSKRYPDLDFKDKRVGFFVGSSNYRTWTKKEYFENVKRNLTDNVSMQDQLLILNGDERNKSGGYDAFVVAWSKILVTDGQKKKLINKINGTQK